MAEQFLPISEDFYSMQCEGITTGYPAYFIRLMNCNLSCGASNEFMKNVRRSGKELDPGTFQGDLHKSGKATWTCDTIPVWIKGHKKPFEYLIDRWKEENILDWVLDGRVNLIWTGGEPTQRMTQKSIIAFLEYFKSNYNDAKVFNEIETNGTGHIEDYFFNDLDQINCSVKLANSGMEKERRIVPSALNRIMEHPNYWFKFVISNEEDMEEIQRDFIKPFNIPADRIILMPGLDDQKNFHERTLFSLEMGKRHGYKGLTRLHVSAWDKTTGV